MSDDMERRARGWFKREQPSQTWRARDLATLLRTIRREALEEAAGKADYATREEVFGPDQKFGAALAAQRVRSLISKETS